MSKVSVRAGSNIAFIKYWGVSDPEINLPLTSSLSMTLTAAYTDTTVELSCHPSVHEDQYTIDGRSISPPASDRLRKHVDRIRGIAGSQARVRVVSQNNFPTASGIASSASGFAALTVATCRAFGLELSDTRLSQIARWGSGSACRSIFGGYVQWDCGTSDDTSVARQLYPPQHWELCDIVAIISREEKQTSSAAGHRLAASSPLNEGRIANVNSLLPAMNDALARRDLAVLGPMIEIDALAMHSVMMTSTPALFYWLPGTLEILHAVRRWREEGLESYFTIDAGPNVHILCEPQHLDELQTRLHKLPAIEQIIVSRPGPGPSLADEHLF